MTAGTALVPAPPTAAGMVPAAVPAGPVPDSAAGVRARIRAATAETFTAETGRRSRDPHSVGISALGRCRRSVAYAVARTPVSDPQFGEQGRAAQLGTWEHEGFLPALAAQLPPSMIERRVVLRAGGLTIPGRIDLDWLPVGPFDVKTVGEHRLAAVMRPNQPFSDHRLQVSGYALARAQEGYSPGYLGWLYMDRASGDEFIIVEPFTNRHVMAVIDRVEQIVALSAAPDLAPRDEMGPGLSPVCNGCPWLRRCWGDDAAPGVAGAQANVIRDRPDIVAALSEYKAAAADESAAGARKEAAAAKLSKLQFGLYGPILDRDDDDQGWRYFRRKPHLATDAKAAAEKLRRLGLTVPQSRRRGAMVIKMEQLPATDQTGE